jgi:hypothetical protein
MEGSCDKKRFTDFVLSQVVSKLLYNILNILIKLF